MQGHIRRCHARNTLRALVSGMHNFQNLAVQVHDLNTGGQCRRMSLKVIICERKLLGRRELIKVEGPDHPSGKHTQLGDGKVASWTC